MVRSVLGLICLSLILVSGPAFLTGCGGSGSSTDTDVTDPDTPDPNPNPGQDPDPVSGDPGRICTDTPELCGTAPLLVPTFQSIGIYWNPTGGSDRQAVQVLYRESGAATWRRGHDLWFDSRSEGAIDGSAEYRGSVVRLEEETAYEVGLVLYDSDQSVLAAAVAETAT